jgi:hypothetical protein
MGACVVHCIAFWLGLLVWLVGVVWHVCLVVGALATNNRTDNHTRALVAHDKAVC